MDQTPTSSSPHRVRTRKRKVNAQKANSAVQNFFGSPLTAPIVATVCGLSYLTYIGIVAYLSMTSVGAHSVGLAKSEYEYGFGRPDQVRSVNSAWEPLGSRQPAMFDQWRYSANGSNVYDVRFDGAGHAQRISCSHSSAVRTACPSNFGIALGDTEDQVGAILGPASSRSVKGTIAIMRYPEIGAEFELSEFRVRRITAEVVRPSSRSQIGRLLRYILP